MDKKPTVVLDGRFVPLDHMRFPPALDSPTNSDEGRASVNRRENANNLSLLIRASDFARRLPGIIRCLSRVKLHTRDDDGN